MELGRRHAVEGVDQILRGQAKAFADLPARDCLGQGRARRDSRAATVGLKPRLGHTPAAEPEVEDQERTPPWFLGELKWSIKVSEYDIGMPLGFTTW